MKASLFKIIALVNAIVLLSGYVLYRAGVILANEPPAPVRPSAPAHEVEPAEVPGIEEIVVPPEILDLASRGDHFESDDGHGRMIMSGSKSAFHNPRYTVEDVFVGTDSAKSSSRRGEQEREILDAATGEAHGKFRKPASQRRSAEQTPPAPDPALEREIMFSSKSAPFRLNPPAEKQSGERESVQPLPIDKPAEVVKRPRVIMGGSKTDQVIIVDPEKGTQKAVPQERPATETKPKEREMMSGTKSRVLIRPRTFSESDDTQKPRSEPAPPARDKPVELNLDYRAPQEPTATTPPKIDRLLISGSKDAVLDWRPFWRATELKYSEVDEKPTAED